jgi:hypothetical protein
MPGPMIAVPGSPAWRLVDEGQGPGEACLIETDGDRAAVEATRPFPVGATLTAIEPTSGTEYRIKVRSGRKLRDGCFRIEGRFISLTKAERAALLSTLGGGR